MAAGEQKIGIAHSSRLSRASQTTAAAATAPVKMPEYFTAENASPTKQRDIGRLQRPARRPQDHQQEHRNPAPCSASFFSVATPEYSSQ